MLFVVKTIDTRKFWVMLTSTLVSSQDLSLQGNAFSLFPTVKLYFCVMCLQSDWWNLMIGVQFCFFFFFSFSSSLDSLVNAHFHFTLPSVVFWQAKAFHNHFQSNASCQRRRLDIGYSHIWYWACQPEAWVRYVNDDFLLTSNHPLNGNPYWNQDFHTLFSFHVLLD